MKNLGILKFFFGIIFTTLGYFNEINAQTLYEKEAKIRDSLYNLYIDDDWCHTSKIPLNQKEPENFNDNRISLFKPHNFRGNSRNSTWNYTQGYGSSCENDCVMATPVVCSNSSNSKFRIPVVFTVSTTGGCPGNAAPTQAEVDAQLAIMNDLYACEATPIEFYKSVSYLGHPSSGDMSTRYLDLGCVYDENNVSNIPGVANIYVFSNTGNGTGCNGFAFLPSGPTAPMTAVMSNACFTGFVYTSGSLNCSAPSLGSGVVLIHEMGHYLGLEHTHGSYVPGPNLNYPGNGGNNTASNNYYGDISAELVNGSNSCTTGDHISDTPADLGISHSIDPQGTPSGTPPTVPNPVGGCATRSGCNITFTCQDANSQTYVPATNNIMSYNNLSGCRTNYSDCQNTKMVDALLCARGPQLCDRNVAVEFGSNPTSYNICIGDPAPTFTATSNCYKWMDGLGDAAIQLATGTTTFTPAIGTGSGQLNNMLPGTYTWYLGDVNELNPNCRTPITVVVSAETGMATINNSSSATICGSQNINLATDVSVLGTNQIIGWWFSSSPLPSFSSQTSLDNAVAAATIGGPLSFPLNHIIASTSGTPLNQLTQTFDCSGLNGNTYYATPIVATQNVPAPTSYSFALNGQSNISSTVNNLPVNVSQLPTNATLTSVCVQISYNACEAFATHNDLDISLMGPNGMTIVLEDFFAGSTNVPTPSTFDVCFVDNGTGYTGASTTGCNASCFSGNLESASSFSSFDGVNPNGTWTLIVNDDFNATFYPCNISVSLNFDMPSFALTFPSPVYTNCVIGSPVTVNCLCASCPSLIAAPANVSIMNSACSTGCTVAGGNIMAPSGTPCPTGSTIEYRVNGGAWSTTLPVYAQTGPAQTIETRCVCDTDNTMFSPSSAAMTTVPGTCTNPTASIAVVETSGTTNNDGIICATANATLTASGGTTYLWFNAATTAGITVTPTGTTTYTVTVSDANGCTDTEVTTITVNPLPTAAISGDLNICIGETTVLTASGGTSYVWSTTATTAGITVAPAGTTTYTVTVTNANGCTNTEVTTITVYPLPIAAISIAETSGTTNNDGIICAGATTALTASGGISYVWSTAATTAGISVTPSSTTTYSVTVSDANGCTDTEVTTITVNPLPTAAIAIAETSGTTNNDGTICAGATSTLTASGGTSYLWSTTATTAGITVTPANTTTYTVTVSDANGCTDIEVTTITVNPLPATPTITITNNVCPSTIGTISATGCGAGTLEWATNAGGPWSTVVPTYTTTAFTVFARCVENGCAGSPASATTAPITCSGSPSTLVQSITTCPQTGVENFDTFTGTLVSIPSGWTTSSADFNPGGYYTNTGAYSNSNSTYALGSSADAAYGAKVPTSGAEATNTMTYCMTNNTGQTINSINVTWDVEQYSIADRATTVDLTYNVNGGAYGQVGISGTSLTTASIQSPASTADANLANIIVTPRNVTFTNTVLPTQQFCIRLTIQNGAGAGSNAHIGFDNVSVTTNCAACPDLSTTPANVTITNSTCDATCTVSGGSITAPSGTPCPTGSTLQYRVDGGAWSTILPVYAQTGPAQSIETRCICDLDGTTASPVSPVITTVPGNCTLPTLPTITIVNNICPSTTGTISATGCGAGTTLEWATNAAGPWSTVVPTYTSTPLTVYARCRDNITNCVSSSASSITAPVSCGTFSFIISDPCSCNNDATLAGNDGTFNEVITVTGPTGFTLTATCVGCTPATLSFTEGPAGTYVSNTFTHVDNVGYSAQIFANGSGIGSISNICAYPNVSVNPIGPFTDCDGQAAVSLTATIVGDNGSGTYVWSGTGVTGSTFNPSGLDPGIVVVSLNYTGVNLGNISPDGVTPAYPGCIQPDTIQVTITQAVAPPVIDNIVVCEGGNTTISVTSAPPVLTSNTFTWNFEGNITGAGISQNSMIVASNAPTQSAGSGLTSVAFQAAGSGCSGAITSSGYDITNTSLADVVTDNEYIEFCVGTPLSGVTFLNVTAMDWSHRISGTGPINWTLVASNALTTPLLSGTISGTSCVVAGGAFSSTATCYRIYYWGGTNASGTLRIDNMVLTANYNVATGTYNFYLTNPQTSAPATPVATGVTYDPATTVGTSPQTIWVTCVDLLTGCESDADTVLVTVNPNPTLTIVQPAPVCSPNTVNVLNVNLGETPVGGTSTYYSTMADATNEINPITTGLDAVGITSTIFVRYELANGCYTIGQINVVINSNPPPPSVPSTITVCSGGSTLITVDTNPLTVTTTWDFEMGISGQGISSNMVVAGNGVTQVAGSGLTSVGPQAAGSGCTAAITSTGYDITNASLADAVADNEYFEFCIGSTMAGFTFNGVNGVNWTHRISGTGPIQWALVAASSPSTAILSGTISGTSCTAAGGAIALNSATCYRVYYWGATNTSGTLRIDNFAINAQYQNLAIYNWYNVNPDANPEAIPVATGNSYDPMTTAATSPQTVWVNCNNGCVSTASQVVINAGITPTVNAVPNQALCPGASTTAVTFSGTPTGVTFTWTNNNTSIGLAASGTGNIPSFVAINTTTSNQVATISVTPSYTSGGVTCMGAPIVFTITVYANPLATIAITETSGLTPNDGIICQGAMATLTASGGATYVWSNGATTAGITTGTAGTYSVTVTSVNGCTAATSSSITVLPLPTPSISVSETSGTVANDGTIYTGSSANLTASGGGTYLWSTGATTAGITVSPSTTTTYTVTVTNANNCSAIAMTTITVVDPPCLLVCSGDQAITLTNGACEYQLPNLVTGAGVCNLFTIEQVSGPEPGDLLPRGTYTITYELVSNLGEVVDECTFTVVVSANPVVVNSLTCNNHINISSDVNCEVTLSPDMFLEGNSYSCYADYQINIWPFNSQANAINNVAQNEGIKLPTGKHTYEIVGPSGNRCWGTFTIEDKLAPVVECNCSVPSEDCTFKCYDLPVVQNETVPMLYGVSPNKSVLTTPPTATDGCGAVSATFTDAINGSDQCDTKELVRSWTFEDASGNKSYCTQRFAFEPISVTDLIPPVREVHLTCGLDASPAAIAGYLDVDSRTQPASATNIGAYADDYAQTGSVVEFNEGYSYGYFTYQLPGYAAPAGQPNLHSQKVDNNVCNLYTTYTDDVIPACGVGCNGNMKVIRNWKLLDWCTGDVFTYIQVIKATDEKAPTFNVKNATVGVDPWGCAANWNVAQPWELADNCAKAEEIKWGVKVPAGVSVSGTAPNYRITGLTKGTHKITYWASDCCGNVSEKDAYVTVIDASAPVAVAKQNIVMSLTGSGTGADGAGKIYGWQIDNGSYDHCSDVRFEVRRVDGGSCGNVGANGTHNNNSTYNDNNGYPSEVPGAVWFHPQDNAQDTDGGEFVKFCCEDIPAGSEFGLHDVELRVWDDGNMNGIIGDNDIINGMKDNYNTTWVTIRVENKLPPALVCPPDATITCDMELNLSLDAETNVNDVNLTMTGYPQAYDLCSNLQVTYKDQWVGQHDPVCKSGTVRRTFKVTKGSVVVTCTQFITVSTLTAPFTVTFPNQNQTTEWDKCNFTLDDARDAANASIKRPIVNYGQCDIVGENITIDTFLFEDGACKKWRVKYSYKNWCTGEEINTIAGQPIVHWYAFKDVTAPVLSCTNQMFAANPNPQNPNGGCEAQVALEASASDKLICAEESWIKWQMFFDGWNDGTVDRLGSSFVNKSWAGIWVPQAKYISGVLNPTWVALQNQHPNLPLADLVYVTYIKPTAASGGTAKLPVGTGATAFILNAENISHKVLWKVTDGCGNVDQCESTVMVVDKKAPTPYCVSVSTALMQTNPQMVELWARDFDKGAFDNCTPQSKLYFTFDGAAPIYSRVNDEHYYKVVGGVSVNATAAEYAQGKAYRWLPASRSAGFVWTAAGDYNVQVSVWDEAWNTDYCTVVLSVRGGNGSTPSSRVSGTVATESGQGVNDVKVTFDANMSEYPKTVQTTASGTFDMSNYNGLTYEITAEKGGDYLNGVSTLDLVMIQRHILGLQALDSNYKLIAADANNDGKVTASDLTDLRKLILGVTTTLPNNTSWKFAVAGTPVQTSPISCVELIEIENLSAEKANQNFVAVKIGDVNGNVSTSVNSPEVESRSNANVEMSVAEASIAAGEVVEIPVTAANFSEVSGFQYTMNLNGASFVGVQSGVLEVNANNVGVITDNVVTMSYASSEAVNANEGAVLFTLTVKADKAMKVSEMISLNSEVTRAESYNSDLKVGRVSLGVRTAPIAGIELFQNEPNPFKGMTTVSFEMPEAATATLSVYDVTGKVVTVRNINAIKGLNSEIFTKDQLGVSGVLYYTLVSGDFTATKKMIIVE